MEITLADKIAQLRQTIAEIETLSEEKRAQLLRSLDEIDPSALHPSEDRQPLIEQLEESLIEVEAKHPEAAQMLRSFTDALSRMGL